MTHHNHDHNHNHNHNRHTVSTPKYLQHQPPFPDCFPSRDLLASEFNHAGRALSTGISGAKSPVAHA